MQPVFRIDWWIVHHHLGTDLRMPSIYRYTADAATEFARFLRSQGCRTEVNEEKT